MSLKEWDGGKEWTGAEPWEPNTQVYPSPILPAVPSQTAWEAPRGLAPMSQATLSERSPQKPRSRPLRKNPNRTGTEEPARVLRLVVPRVLKGSRNVSPTCGVCGAPLPAPQATGRPRTTCGEACRRRRERLVRMVRRRLEWIDVWKEQGPGAGCSARRIRAKVAELRHEISELEAGRDVGGN
jgi:hypothetical protein